MVGGIALAGVDTALASLPDDRQRIAALGHYAGHLRIAQQAGQRTFDLPAQPLASALRQFSEQTGIQLAYSTRDLEGRATGGITGLYTPRDALRELLKDEPLQHRFTSGDAVVIRLAQADDAVALDGIVVVGGETVERTVQETSTSVAVITGEELDRSPVTDIYDVIERTPNVGQPFGEFGFSIRGIDQRGPGGAGQGLVVNTIIDGVSLPSNLTNFHAAGGLWDLEQIEILRGPQSTQQGRNALAGAIIVRSKDPFHGREVKLRQDVETLDGWRSAFAFNEQLVPEVLSLRVSGERYHTDGSLTAPTLNSDDIDSENLWVGRAKLLFTPKDDLRIVAGYTFTENRDGDSGDVLGALFPDERITLTGVEGTDGTLNHAFNLRAEYRLNDVFTLYSETSYFEGRYDRLSGSVADPDPRNSTFVEEKSEVFSQETKLAFNSERVNGAVGVYYTDFSTDAPGGGTVPGELLGIANPDLFLTLGFNNIADVKNIAFFGEADIKLFDRWTLTVGGRYDREEFRRSAQNDGVTSNIPLPFPLGTASRQDFEGQFQAFLPKVALAYNFTDDVKVGGVVQRGYRAGGAGLNAFTGETFEFDPEFTWNYEVFLRSQWWDRRITTNVNVFYTDWTDQQVIVLGPSGLTTDTRTVNAGKSRSYGAELEVDARLTHRLSVFGAFGYVNNKFVDFVNATSDFSGNAFPNSPEYTAAAGASFRFGTGWEVHGEVSYTGDSEGDQANTPEVRIDGRVLVNARFGYATERWETFLFARNLFDEDYLFRILTPFTEPQFRVGEPRVIGVTARARF